MVFYSRIIFVVFSLIFFSACDTSSTDRKKTTTQQNNLEKTHQIIKNDKYLFDSNDINTTTPWKIAYILQSNEKNNPYWNEVRKGVSDASRDYGIEVHIKVPHEEHYHVGLQVSLIEALAQSDFDGIVLAPIDSNILVKSVEKLIEQGKHVVVHDTPLNSTKVKTQLMFDNFEAGKRIATWVRNRLNHTGKVVLFNGEPNSQNGIERRNGILESLASSDIEVLNMKSANWSREIARDMMHDWLLLYDDIDAVICSSDGMALGALEAIENLNRSGIIITGVDATSEALSAIKEGRIDATIDQAPRLQARKAIQLLIRSLENNESYPLFSTWRESPLITIDNVDELTR